MNHTIFRELISAYADGEISGDEQTMLTRHMEQCAECRLFLEQIRQTSLAVKATGDIRLAQHFTYGVLRSVRQEQEESRAWLPIEHIARRFVFGLSVAVMLFVSVSIVLETEDPVVMEPYLAGEQTDSSVTRTLLTKEDLSKEDVLFAAVTRR